MTSKRTRVFLTGAAGNWGRFTLNEFRSRADRFDVVALVLPTPGDTASIRDYEGMPNLEVRFGDLTDYAAVESCVRGADFVVHLGGIVSPVGDDDPELARRVNVGGMRNIVRAVHAQPDPSIGVIGIGTVAQTGDRNPPHHWGRIGDPLRARISMAMGKARSRPRRFWSTPACRNGSGCARRASFIPACWPSVIRS